MAGPVRISDIRNHHAAGSRGMQEFVVFQINADMPAMPEKHQITGLQIGSADMRPGAKLLGGGAWQINAK